MATSKKRNTYISYDLEWLRKKVNELKQYVNDRPFHELKAQIEWKQTANGGQIPMIVETISSQLKTLKDILKDMPAMFDAINKLEEAEAEKNSNVRGGQTLNPLEGGEI